jgi:tRNA threonylcarbamoyladenosine biosynthesis protein TsaB
MIKQTILFIDTTDNTKSVIQLEFDGKLKTYEEKSGLTKSQAVLPLIEKALKENKLELKDLTELKVNPGPGSFTGTRVGISIANALGWALKIPVNGKRMEAPKYKLSKFD